MKRLVLLASIAALAIAPCARAGVTYQTLKVDDRETEVVQLSVTPAPEPEPVLRHRLIARDVDLVTGNAVPFYYRAMLELAPTMKRLREKFDEEKELSLWYGTGEEATPIDKLPLEKVREAVQMFEPIYRNHLRLAFQRSDCDWELGIGELRGIDIISFLLPEFQDSREIARMQALRTRLALAEHRYDDAIEIMRQQYRLGNDVSQPPFLVCGLIGIAIDGITNGTLIELIASKDSPNMYWALTELPQPAIDLRRAARFEMDFGPRMFPFIDHPETAEHAPEEWNRLYVQSLAELGAVSGEFNTNASSDQHSNALNQVKAAIGATGLGLIGYSHAKERLVAQGMDRAMVEKMAVGQVIAIYTNRIYRRFSDAFEKLWYVPYKDMKQLSNDLENRLNDARVFGNGDDREILPIVSTLLPAVNAARGAQVRLEREVAALRIIEALRMHAASHGGALPGSLADITAVPIPDNPATGKPFEYQLQGTTGVLELPESDGLYGGNRRYEIQIVAGNK